MENQFAIGNIVIGILLLAAIGLMISGFSFLWRKCPNCKKRGHFKAEYKDNYQTIIIGQRCTVCNHLIEEPPRPAFDD